MRAISSGLLLYDRETKTIKDLLPKFDNWVDEFAWGLNSITIYFASSNHGEENIYRASFGRPEPVLVATRGEYSDLKVIPAQLNRPTSDIPDGLLAYKDESGSSGRGCLRNWRSALSTKCYW